MFALRTLEAIYYFSNLDIYILYTSFLRKLIFKCVKWLQILLSYLQLRHRVLSCRVCLSASHWINIPSSIINIQLITTSVIGIYFVEIVSGTKYWNWRYIFFKLTFSPFNFKYTKLLRYFIMYTSLVFLISGI